MLPLRKINENLIYENKLQTYFKMKNNVLFILKEKWMFFYE